jgi:large subunit ribosomal protein L10
MSTTTENTRSGWAAKGEAIAAFGENAAKAPFIVVTEFRGTKVADINQFRRDLEKAGMRFKVMKNTLARRAFDAQGVDGLNGSLKGMTGIVLSSSDGVASARVLRDLLKNLQTVQVRAAYFEGTSLGADGVKNVADMPGKEALLALILAPAQNLLYLLSNYATKLEEGGEQG